LNDKKTWQCYYYDLSIPVLPMHIFRLIAMGSWPCSAWPAGTPAITDMNLMPPEIKAGGADLLYGTGPWILTNGSLGNMYKFLPYVAGTTYGPAGHTVTETNSYFAYVPPGVYDLAAVSLNPTQRLVLPGAAINITVQVQNQGTTSETSNLTLYAGTTLLGARSTGVLPPPLNSTGLATFVFFWDTTSSAPGSYDLKAIVSPVKYETDLSDNTLVNGTVIIAATTPTGSHVTVAPAPNTQVTFTQTTTAGVTTLNVTQPSSSTLTAAANSVFVDIKTNATYSGNVTLQFAYNPAGLTLEDEKAMRMWLWNATSSTWRDITTYVNTTSNIVYGVSPHLSMFGITCTLGLTGSNGYQIPTTVGTPASPPSLPDYLADLAYFDIQATAQYASPVTVRLAYDPSTITQQQVESLQMWVWDGAKWVDITSRVDTINSVIYGVSSHLSMFGITALNPEAATGVTPTAGMAGITGYKLAFKETVCTPFSLSATIDYYWSFSVEKWSGTQWVASGIGGSTASVTGYSIAALSTVDLPCSAYVVSPSSVAWGDWLRVSFTFHWTYSGTDYSVDYVVKLHVHPGDIAGAALVFPYLGADGIINLLDLNHISFNWNKPVSWTGTFNPLDSPHLGDINGDGIINLLDLNNISLKWGRTWTNAPPS
jgi:hypothetical protein